MRYYEVLVKIGDHRLECLMDVFWMSIDVVLPIEILGVKFDPYMRPCTVLSYTYVACDAMWLCPTIS